MKWSLNKKLILIMVSLSTATILTMLAFDLYSERVLYATIGHKIANIMDSTRVAIEEMTKKKEVSSEDLHSSLTRLHSEGLREINIIDSAIRIRASTNREKIGKDASPEITDLVFKSEEGEFVLRTGDLYNVIIPIVVKGEHQGYLHLVISTEDISGIFRAHIARRIAVALFLLLGGVIAAVWLSRKYTRPIKEVVTAARSVSAGDLDISLPVTEKDEIKDLKESFNQMVKRLHELRDLEERLRETEHLSTIGELSRSLAHEIRNPLNFISLSVDHLLDHTDQRTGETLRRIKEEIKRLDTLVGNFLSYGKPLRLKKRPTPIVALLEDTLGLVRAKAEKVGIKIFTEYNGMEDSIVTVDAELLKTCLFNIVLNAFQAMEDGGELRVRLLRVNRDFAVSVSDTGKGLDRERSRRVFEPFFTTKERGVGLGLPMTKRVIEEHGGSVEFESSPGKGTTVTITLPVGENKGVA